MKKNKPYNGRMVWVIEASYASGKKWSWHVEPPHVYNGPHIAKAMLEFLMKSRTSKKTRYRTAVYEPR